MTACNPNWHCSGEMWKTIGSRPLKRSRHPGGTKPVFCWKSYTTCLLEKEGCFLSRWLSGKESACPCRRHKRHKFDPWVGKIPLEKEMATHASILAWKIPQTEEPGRLYSPWGHKRVGFDLVIKQQLIHFLIFQKQLVSGLIQHPVSRREIFQNEICLRALWNNGLVKKFFWVFL